MIDAPLPADAETGGELSLRIVGGLLRHLEETQGLAALEEVLEGTHITREDVERGHWAQLEGIEHLLENVRRHYPDDVAFTRAFGHRLAETLGPMRYLAWATTPIELFVRGLRSIDTLSSISHAEVTEEARGRLRVRYWSDRNESRLLCLSRIGQLSALPSLWGLPPAIFEEKACIAHGDPHCIYLVRVPERRRVLPEVFGLGLGVLAALVAARAYGSHALLLTLPLMGLFAGRAYGHDREARAHQEFAAQSAQALRQLVLEGAEARRELVDLHERQQRWTRHVEAQLAERVATSQRLVARFAAEREAHAHTVRGVSHDLRNPIATLVMLEWQLRRALHDDPRHREMLDDHAAAVDQLDRMVDELVRDVHGSTVARPTDYLEVAPMVERLQSRLRALVYPRDIAVAVSATGRAPCSIEVDSLVFDRVVDNLLTNAVKYTDRGRIEVELGGDAELLSVRVTDTGRGIAEGRIQEIFRAPTEPVRDARGRPSKVGLSTVVQLLGENGGRLEVTSKLGVGTTFWAHFPVRPGEHRRPGPDDPHGEELVRKIVRFRSDPPGARPKRGS